MLLNRGCVECRKAELVSIWTRTTCWVTRSLASVKSSRLLLWLTLPATTSTLHHDLFHDSKMLVKMKMCSASGLTLITWRNTRTASTPTACRCLVTFLYVQYKHAHTVQTACLSVASGIIKSVRAGRKKRSYVVQLSVTFAVCPYDITQRAGNQVSVPILPLRACIPVSICYLEARASI